jgi:two-component system, LytTR family, response regulator LytT
MIKIAIVEDELYQAESLKSNIERFFANTKKEYSVLYFENAQKFLNSYSADYSLIFMDINLPDIDGMNAAKEIRKKDKYVMIIFVTSLAQYAIKGYEVNAFDFIVKPVSYFNFALKFKRAVENLIDKEEKSILISNKTSKRKMLISEIMYIEVSKHTLLFHLENEVFSTTGSLKTIQKELEDFPFELCNQCYLVNLKYVKKIVDFTVIVGSDSLLISHPKKKDFIHALNYYLNHGGE